jgi:hypothetical protein
LQAFPVSEIGVRDQAMIFEDGTLPGSNLALDASAASTDVGDGILFEDGDGIDLEDGFQMTGDTVLYETATVTHTFDITHGVGTGGSRMMTEKSYTPSGDGDSVLVKEIVIKISARPKPKFQRNLLTYLAEYPFGNELGGDGILMEGTTFSDFDVIQLDGTLPLDQADTFFQLERDVETDNMLLDGTSAAAQDADDAILLEDGFILKLQDVSLGREYETFNIASEEDDGHSRILQEGGEWNFPAGYVVNEGDRIILDGTNSNEETIPLSDIGHYRFSDILTTDKFIINDGNTNKFIKDAGLDVGLQLEDFGQILLEDGEYLGQETTKRNRFDLEENGSLIVESYDTTSIIDLLVDETNEDTIVLEDATESRKWFKSTYTTDTTATTSGIALETTNVILSTGQIPVENLTINSSKGGLPVVRSADIHVRDTGDVALEDATDTTHGFLVNETNGDNIQFEGATGITY